MRTPLLAAATIGLLAASPASAALVTETYTPSISTTAIPDNQPVLTLFPLRVNASAIRSLSEITIRFELRGTGTDAGWAGDMVGLLLKSPLNAVPSASDPAAVLLNQVGVTALDPNGFGYDGWNITLSDAAAGDIHSEVLPGGILTGTFQPDGRLNPTDSLRPSKLGVFNGGDGNGDWSLNLGDLALGGTMQLVGWSLTLTGEDTLTPVPEASTWAAGIGLAALAAGTAWRRSGNRARAGHDSK